MFQVWVSFIAFLIPPPPATVAAPPAGPAPLAAFTSNELWDADFGKTRSRLGLERDGIYLFRPGDRIGSKVPVRDRGCCVYNATLSPGADLVAYSTIDSRARLGDRGEPGWGVWVVDLSGREVAAFPTGRHFQWSPDGSRLAIRFAYHDTNWAWAPAGIGIWRRSDGTREHFPLEAGAIHWGRGDTLYLAAADGVDALDVNRGRVSRTRHVGPDISPDGRFSILHGIVGVRRLQLYEDRDQLNLTHCALYYHNAEEKAGFDPFWVRAPGAQHLLCLGSGENPWNPPPGQAGFRTGLFDPRTLEMVRWFDGKPVAPTADQRGVLVLRSDTIAVEPLDASWEPVATGSTVRVRVEVRSWGGPGVVRAITGGRLPDFKAWTHDVALGEWLSDHSGMDGACDRFFRVIRIIDRDRIVVAFGPGRHLVIGPGGTRSEATTAVISRSGTSFQLNSTCGGAETRLTIVD